mmetsp:Transcript_12334/g.29548  ORF Transcript_12334/g.29548 Transcript_12334/m.29548 type:complete len:210 (+) Transcript_12334:220-849(+)
MRSICIGSTSLNATRRRDRPVSDMRGVHGGLCRDARPSGEAAVDRFKPQSLIDTIDLVCAIECVDRRRRCPWLVCHLFIYPRTFVAIIVSQQQRVSFFGRSLNIISRRRSLAVPHFDPRRLPHLMRILMGQSISLHVDFLRLFLAVTISICLFHHIAKRASLSARLVSPPTGNRQSPPYPYHDRATFVESAAFIASALFTHRNETRVVV